MFAGWYGDMPGGKCMDASITLDLHAKPNGMYPYVFARFPHPWASAPSGKVWICHRPSPFDPKGTRFIIR